LMHALHALMHAHYHPTRRATIALPDVLEKLVNGSEPYGLADLVLSGFLRVVTHPNVFDDPTPPADAVAFVSALVRAARVEVLDTGSEWPLLLDLCSENDLAGNDIPDAWIAAAVRTRHEHLVTFDRGFRRFLKPGALTVLDVE
jgi:uncharacterized protein